MPNGSPDRFLLSMRFMNMLTGGRNIGRPRMLICHGMSVIHWRLDLISQYVAAMPHPIQHYETVAMVISVYMVTSLTANLSQENLCELLSRDT